MMRLVVTICSLVAHTSWTTHDIKDGIIIAGARTKASNLIAISNAAVFAKAMAMLVARYSTYHAATEGAPIKQSCI